MAGVAFPMNQPDFPWRRGHGFHPIDKMGYGLWVMGERNMGFRFYHEGHEGLEG